MSCYPELINKYFNNISESLRKSQSFLDTIDEIIRLQIILDADNTPYVDRKTTKERVASLHRAIRKQYMKDQRFSCVPR